MTNNPVVIVSNSKDVHADKVSGILEARQVPRFRIDLDRFPRDYRLSLELTGDRWAGEIHCDQTGTSLQADQAGSIWMRKPAALAFAERLGAQEQLFATQEANHCLLGWLYSLDCFFMSHPASLRAAGWKCEQLVRARRFGFDVPATIVSNVPEKVRHFARDGRSGAVFKTLSTPTLAHEQVDEQQRSADGLHTTMVAADDPEIDSIRIVPGQFQHYVEKDHEVRVTVVAGEAFVARIDSQANARTMVDYRYYEADVAYSRANLPQEIVQRCCDFVASYGLAFGAIDLIAAADGRFVFLENNPVGQFIFVEELVPELEISAAVADALIRGSAQ